MSGSVLNPRSSCSGIQSGGQKLVAGLDTPCTPVLDSRRSGTWVGDEMSSGDRSIRAPEDQGVSRGLRVLLVGDAFSFPNGQGATARVEAVARGLASAGCRVRIVVTRPSESPSSQPLNRDVCGTIGGIPFEYTSGSTMLSPSFWGRRAAEAMGLMRAALIAAQGCDAVVVHTMGSLFVPLVVGSAAKMRGAVVVKAASELPFVHSRGASWRSVFQWWHVRITQRRYDGVIVISAYLDDYFRRVSRARTASLLVPILVDVGDFEAASSATSPERNMILYAGNLDQVGEVETLLRVFARVAMRPDGARLTILGDSYCRGRRERLERMADIMGIGGTVEFAGLISRRDLPQRLSRASALVLPRASGKFSTAGLPTKLAEYLATGRPVVVTGVGDIPRYLHDGHDAYLVPPDDEEAFCSRLEHVLDCPDEAATVGLRGRELARREFDYRTHGRRIARFLIKLKSERGSHSARCRLQ